MSNTALLFPGQGSQSVGMLLGLGFPEVRETYAEASEALGWDLLALIAEGPEAALNETERTQPALLAAGIALWRVWQREGLPTPAALAGHSLGEYTALVAAGALGFADALRLVAERGRLMQAAVPAGQGGMVAVIGLDDAAVEALCQRCPVAGVLEPVNYNAPGQVVVAGDAAPLAWLEAEGKGAGARMLVRLPVSVPSHCALMKPAAERLAERLSEVPLRPTQIPVYNNIDARARTQPADIRLALAEQLYRPVRWTQTVERLSALGVSIFVECGPGKVLSGLGKRIVKTAQHVPLDDAAAFATVRERLGPTT